MSLIADALKRAKAAQQTAPRPDSAAIPYQPPDPKAAPAAGAGRWIVLPAGLLVLTVAALAVVWLGLRKGSSITPVAATATTTRLAAVPSQPPPAIPQLPSTAAPTAAPAVISQTVTAPAPGQSAQTPAETLPTPASKPADPVIEPAPQNPPPLRLQAIFFSPSHPWAMIGGKTLYVGDQLGDFKVVAIAAESATLVSGGQTNILTVSR